MQTCNYDFSFKSLYFNTLSDAYQVLRSIDHYEVPILQVGSIIN